METNSGIYAITNKIDGKVYVGSTKNLKRRRYEHMFALQQNEHGNLHLQSSWNKYGEGVFEFMICEYVNDFEYLVEREQYWLDFHRLFVGVYNTILVVDRPSGMLGKRHSEETRQQMSISAYNRPPVSDETKLKLRKSHLGRTAWNKGKKLSEEGRQKLSEAHTGKTLTEEHKRNISQGLLNMDLEVAAERSRKLSEAGRGRKHTEESKRKMSEAAIGNQNGLGSHSNLGYKHSKETKRRMSETMKRVWAKKRAMGVA